MNPIATLKKGITNANWNEVCKAYTAMTGETINIAECHDVVSMDYVAIERCVRELTELLEKKGWVSEKRGSKPNTIIEDEFVDEPKTNRKVTNGLCNPVIVDEANPSDDEIELNEIFRTYHKKKRRQSAKSYNIVCSVCNKKFKSPDKPKSDIGQQCDNCLAQKTPR